MGQSFQLARELIRNMPDADLEKVDIYLTQVTPTGSMAGCGGISAQPEGV